MLTTRSRCLARLGLLALLAAAASAGCKANPAKDSGFLPDPQPLVKDRERFPFHRVWFAEAWNDPRYRTVFIAPINTDYVADPNAWAKTNLKGYRIDEDVENLAAYVRTEFEEAFRNDPEHRYEVVEEPQPDSLAFELALIEVVPNKATLGALGMAAMVVAPPGTGIAAKEIAKGVVAIEGRVRACDSGEIVAMFADRETGKFGPINLRRATWYGHAHKIIQEWAEQWVEISSAELGEKVKDTRTWTLMPW